MNEPKGRLTSLVWEPHLGRASQLKVPRGRSRAQGAMRCEYPDCRELATYKGWIGPDRGVSVPGLGYRLEMRAAVYGGILFMCREHMHILKEVY